VFVIKLVVFLLRLKNNKIYNGIIELDDLVENIKKIGMLELIVLPSLNNNNL
jgi:hypothetical protein